MEEGIIYDWLIEVLYNKNELAITLNDNIKLVPTYIILNDNENTKIKYNSKISIKDTNKTDLTYAQIEV
ncbi:hypothetical protein ACSVDA_13705 [Cytobacillus sp. Hm23]